ncbi:MAG: CoA transferase [Pseudomonadota bacterium]
MTDRESSIAPGRNGPLADLRVLDLTRIRAGPTAVRQFADWGADVIRIEAPEGLPDDPLSAARDLFDFQNLHRNKRSVCLNLRTEEGRDILYRLAEDADVVFENARPDVKKRLKIDYPDLRAINPRLVYVSISGFGQDGPYAGRPGFDQIAQGMGGVMSVTGTPGEGPMRVGTAISDLTSGYFAAMGAMMALHERQHSGEGQFVCTSLLQAQIALMDFQASRFLIDGVVPEQVGNDHPYLVPMGVFGTRDGNVNIAAATEEQWCQLCTVLDSPELAVDARFDTIIKRIENKQACNASVEALTQQFSTTELVDKLNEHGVPAGPIYDMREVFEDAQVQHLGMAAPVAHPTLGDMQLVSQPIQMSRTPLQPFTPTPQRGENTESVLQELGFGAEQIDALRERQII